MRQWISKSLNRWTHESPNQGTNESTNQRINESMNQWPNGSVNQWVTEEMNQWINDSMNQGFNMIQWVNESLNQWSQWISGWTNQWTNESTVQLFSNQWIIESLEWLNEGTNESMNFANLVLQKTHWSPQFFARIWNANRAWWVSCHLLWWLFSVRDNLWLARFGLAFFKPGPCLILIIPLSGDLPEKKGMNIYIYI